MNAEKDKWTALFGWALVWYVPVGFLFYNWHKDDPISVWALVGLYIFSPVIVAIAAVLPVAFCVALSKAEKRLAPYFSVLADIEGRQKKAVREGRKMAALGWKFMWVLIFSPIGLVLVWWVVSIDR